MTFSETNPIARKGCFGDASDFGLPRTGRNTGSGVPIGAMQRRGVPDIVLGIFKVAGQNRDRLPPAGAHDRHSVMTPHQKFLRPSYTQGVTAEGVNRLGVEPGFVGRLLDQALHKGSLKRPVNRLALVDAAEKWIDRRPTPLKPAQHVISRPAGREGDTSHPEGIRLAAADCDAEGPVTSFRHIVRTKRHQFRPTGQKVVTQGEHRSVAQAPRCLGLDGEQFIKDVACNPLRLLGAGEFGSPHTPKRQIDFLVIRRSA